MQFCTQRERGGVRLATLRRFAHCSKHTLRERERKLSMSSISLTVLILFVLVFSLLLTSVRWLWLTVRTHRVIKVHSILCFSFFSLFVQALRVVCLTFGHTYIYTRLSSLSNLCVCWTLRATVHKSTSAYSCSVGAPLARLMITIQLDEREKRELLRESSFKKKKNLISILYILVCMWVIIHCRVFHLFCLQLTSDWSFLFFIKLCSHDHWFTKTIEKSLFLDNNCLHQMYTKYKRICFFLLLSLSRCNVYKANLAAT